METQYNPMLVTLSIIVAIFASYVSLNLAHSVTQAKGYAQIIWLACGSLAMGVGIWSMHFVGMLAFEMPGMDMAYDVPLMILSVVVAVAASALALFIMSRSAVPTGSLLAGGVAMAAAIAGMHYIGMYSMRMAATIQWNIYLVVLSIVIAFAASIAALLIALKLRNNTDRYLQLAAAATMMGIAISGMHYTGMIAATFVHAEAGGIQDENLLVTSGLAVAVIITTFLILCLALVGSVGHRLWMQKRRWTDEVLLRSEERFRALVDAVKDYAICMLDPHGYISTWNRGAERITGYTANEAIGHHVSIFYRKEDADSGVAETEMKTAATTGHFEGEAQRVRRDGSTFWASVVLTPLYDNEKKLVGFSKVTRDVTELRAADMRMRKLNEELEKRVADRTHELQRRESQLRTIANALPILVGQLDQNEKFLFANDALAAWFARTAEQMTGASFQEVLGEDGYRANFPFIHEALTGKVTNHERLSKSGSREAVLNITFVPEFDKDGQVIGFILVASDVTGYKEIETELKTAKEAAEVASETKSAFLANMSHEIRTPLGAILGFSELITNQEMTVSERASGIEIIKRNGRLLSNIINDILDLSKVEAGKLRVEKINAVIEEVLK
ncbi:MAG: MHYT domain-containing protein, partial [Bdellovibrionota bacterium]